jgi:hypothetical protein
MAGQYIPFFMAFIRTADIAAMQRINPITLSVLVNDRDPLSVCVAHYYRHQRR